MSHSTFHNDSQVSTSEAARLAARHGRNLNSTSGIAPGYLQANMIVLPSRYAADFRTLCGRNPVPCPLIAESASKGCYNIVKSCILGLEASTILAKGADLRRDIPRYMVYRDSKLEKSHSTDIMYEWTDDHVAFLIGCSYSFETELSAAGLAPRQIVMGRNIPMYRTSLPLCPSGIFTGGTYVVSMRPYKRRDIDQVRRITRQFGATHGEPIAWGWQAVKSLGISNIDEPEWGDAPLGLDGRLYGQMERDQDGEDDDIPVFWGCGVTPQEAVMRAGLQGTVMAHAPGHMLILDARDEDIMR